MQKRLRAATKWLSNPLHFYIVLCSLIFPLFVFGYMNTYGPNLPIDERLWNSTPVAVAAKNGTLTFRDLTSADEHGHRMFFGDVIVTLLTYTTNWNVDFERLLTLGVALINFGLLIALIRWCYPSITILLLIPVSALVFTVQQTLVWLYNSCHHTMIMFLLLASWILSRYPVGWRALGAAALMGLCATFSFGSGIAIWPAVFLTLWLFGYRKWQHFAFWMAAAAASLGLYLWDSGINTLSTPTDTAPSRINLPLLSDSLKFTFTFAGNPLYAGDRELTHALGILGVIVLAANSLYLWRQDRNSAKIGVWGMLALFPLGAGGLISLTRLVWGGMSWATLPHYTSMTHLLWTAVLVSIVAAVWKLARKNTAAQERWKTALLWGNLFALALITVFFAYAVLHTWQNEAIHRDGGDDGELSFSEQPYNAYEIYGMSNIFSFPPAYKEHHFVNFHLLAAHRLALFSDWEPQNLLPDLYQPGQVVVVETPSAWFNVAVRDWLLAGVEPAATLHIVPDPQTPGLDQVPNPLLNLVATDAADTPERIRAFVEGDRPVWHIRLLSHGESAFEAAIRSSDYSANPGLQTDEVTFAGVPIPTDITVTAYHRLPAQTETSYTFGDAIQLQSWTFKDDVHVTPCQPVTLLSWWATDKPLEHDYILSIAIGAGRARSDFVYPTRAWETGRLYFDERAIAVPCDIEPGEHVLLMGWHERHEDGSWDMLPYRLGDQEPVGGLAYLTTLFVE